MKYITNIVVHFVGYLCIMSKILIQLSTLKPEQIFCLGFYSALSKPVIVVFKLTFRINLHGYNSASVVSITLLSN